MSRNGMRSLRVAPSPEPATEEVPRLGRDLRYAVIERLNGVLAQLIDASLAAAHAHWNVRGPTRMSLAGALARAQHDLAVEATAIGERITALGGVAEGTVQAVARDSALEPYPILALTEREHIGATARRLGALSRAVAQAAAACEHGGDQVSAHLLLEAAGRIDRLIWLVESHRVAEG